MSDPQLSELAKGLASVYQPEGIAIWLFAAHQSFGGRSAAELWINGEREPVLAEVDRLVSGAFS